MAKKIGNNVKNVHGYIGEMSAVTEGYRENTLSISSAAEEQLATTVHVKNSTAEWREITENLNKQISTILLE